VTAARVRAYAQGVGATNAPEDFAGLRRVEQGTPKKPGRRPDLKREA
jgi:hypothetical protein